MPLRYERADTLGDGWTEKVIRSGVTVGRIVRSPDGRYRFYEGAGGAGSTLLPAVADQDDDLDRLKQRLEDRYRR